MASENVLSPLAEYFLPLKSPDGELEIRLFFESSFGHKLI